MPTSPSSALDDPDPNNHPPPTPLALAIHTPLPPSPGSTIFGSSADLDFRFILPTGFDLTIGAYRWTDMAEIPVQAVWGDTAGRKRGSTKGEWGESTMRRWEEQVMREAEEAGLVGGDDGAVPYENGAVPQDDGAVPHNDTVPPTPCALSSSPRPSSWRWRLALACLFLALRLLFMPPSRLEPSQLYPQSLAVNPATCPHLSRPAPLQPHAFDFSANTGTRNASEAQRARKVHVAIFRLECSLENLSREAGTTVVMPALDVQPSTLTARPLRPCPGPASSRTAAQYVDPSSLTAGDQLSCFLAYDVPVALTALRNELQQSHDVDTGTLWAYVRTAYFRPAARRARWMVDVAAAWRESVAESIGVGFGGGEGGHEGVNVMDSVVDARRARAAMQLLTLAAADLQRATGLRVSPAYM
ncbi:hypothetical protein Tdes44962_MAKER09562 [Teratosphaeria destructans]|uniref:Uncharacterized protein n=1 Tax=Teratosphaeria destructans TaxID=418781 RepID=A0A9W7SSJ8_9PEZI|nr:hypothetical protein Tdes44962_MAKER09562 [Teratosphaeria destructans]